MIGRAIRRQQLAQVATAALTVAVAVTAVAASGRRLAPDDRAAFRQWFVLVADAQFEQRAPEVTDCAALVRYAFREALRPHSPEWARRTGLTFVPRFADVRSGPAPGPDGWPLFRTAAGDHPRYGEFADAQTLVRLNSRLIARDAAQARPGDLLYFRRAGAVQPDHLMVFVGPSAFDPGGDWVVYHTGPDGDDAGEVRKVRLSDLHRHPSPTWRPIPGNQTFVGVFRLDLL
ncbi:MAG: DUF1175 family protein [Vicinamibacterales bacterium]